MKRLLLSIGLLLAGTRFALADECPVGTLASYVGALPCEVGSLTFSGFNYTTGGANLLPASMITVTPTSTPGLGSGFTFSAPWRALSGQDSETKITYTATGEIVSAVLMMQGFGALGSGEVRVAETTDDGLNLLVFKTSDLLMFNASTRFDSVSGLRVTDDITLDAHCDGFAALNFATNLYSTPQPAPEPTTCTLLATGLAGLVALVRRKLTA